LDATAPKASEGQGIAQASNAAAGSDSLAAPAGRAGSTGWGSLPDDDRPHYGVSVRYEEDGTAVLTARLPAEQAAIVLAALERSPDHRQHP
jgi:hypothetical protein